MSVFEEHPAAVPKEPSFPPHTIYDENGTVTGVILAVSDYQLFLRLLAKYADWEALAVYWQDAVDNMLADEAEAEGGEVRLLEEVLAEYDERQ